MHSYQVAIKIFFVTSLSLSNGTLPTHIVYVYYAIDCLAELASTKQSLQLKTKALTELTLSKSEVEKCVKEVLEENKVLKVHLSTTRDGIAEIDRKKRASSDWSL